MGRNSTEFWRAAAAVALASALLSGQAAARTESPTVVEAEDLVALLASDLASEPSATAVLQQWCSDRDLADPAIITAEQQFGHDKPVTARIRALLHAAPDEPVRYRRVALSCGRHVLSRADNWYRPGQLTAAMNTELDTTDHPFGAVVRALGFHRQSLSAEVLMKSDALTIPSEIIRNKALLETADGTPFSLVTETYSRTILDAGSASRPRLERARSTRRPRTRTAVVVREAAPQRPHRHRSEHVRAEHFRVERFHEHRSEPRDQTRPRLSRAHDKAL
jgi:chorismate-pyruvate lyase